MKYWTGLVFLAVWLSFPALGWADEPAEEQEQVTEQEEQEAVEQSEAAEEALEAEEPAGPNLGSIYLAAGIDYTSDYVYRGFVIEDEGFILQPWVQGGVTLYQGEVGLTSIDLLIDRWNSLHYDTSLGAGTPYCPQKWYEGDLYLTLSLTFLESITFDAAYWWYTSPNGSFMTYEEVNLYLAYDDSALWSNIGFFGGIQPSVTLGVEIDGQSDGGQNEGLFFGPGIEPSLTFGDEDGLLVHLSVPLSLGLSLSDYYEREVPQDDIVTYEDELFGYFDVGLVVGIPLVFIPERFGSWELSGNFHAVIQGTTLKDYNGEIDPDTGELTEQADAVHLFGGGGLSLSY